VQDASPAIVALDLGGSNIKSGIVDGASGAITAAAHVKTVTTKGSDGLLDQLAALARAVTDRARAEGAAPAAAGVATAGWVDPVTGAILHATGNLPQWTGAPVRAAVEAATGLPAFVENDANAFAAAEKRFGSASDLRSFLCITLGTGVGGGCYVNGRLLRGAHGMANLFGHVAVAPDGAPCTCGLRGCVEAYSGAAALTRSVLPANFGSARGLIAAANREEGCAREAVRGIARQLARAVAVAIHLLDPEAIILGGGLAQDNPTLLRTLEDELGVLVMAWPRRPIPIRVSGLGYHAGVIGAAAIAMEGLAGGA
jgi:predicted NBD/HSP70 family sugar kinase